MALYWRGKLSLEDPLLKAFWEKEPDALRGHALGYVGGAFQQTHGEIPGEIFERLKLLWAARLAWAKQAQSSEFGKEMAAFGRWFVSDKFDRGWATAQLLESLQLAHQTVHEDLVLEHLERTVEIHPVESVQCLRILVEGDREGRTLYAGRNHVRRILEVHCKVPSLGRMRRGSSTILAAEGFWRFGICSKVALRMRTEPARLLRSYLRKGDRRQCAGRGKLAGLPYRQL